MTLTSLGTHRLPQELSGASILPAMLMADKRQFPDILLQSWHESRMSEENFIRDILHLDGLLSVQDFHRLIQGQAVPSARLGNAICPHMPANIISDSMYILKTTAYRRRLSDRLPEIDISQQDYDALRCRQLAPLLQFLPLQEAQAPVSADEDTDEPLSVTSPLYTLLLSSLETFAQARNVPFDVDQVISNLARWLEIDSEELTDIPRRETAMRATDLAAQLTSLVVTASDEETVEDFNVRYEQFHTAALEHFQSGHKAEAKPSYGFGRALTFLRKFGGETVHDITARYYGKKVGRQTSDYWRWETEKVWPRNATMKIIAHLFPLSKEDRNGLIEKRSEAAWHDFYNATTFRDTLAAVRGFLNMNAADFMKATRNILVAEEAPSLRADPAIERDYEFLGSQQHRWEGGWRFPKSRQQINAICKAHLLPCEQDSERMRTFKRDATEKLARLWKKEHRERHEMTAVEEDTQALHRDTDMAYPEVARTIIELFCMSNVQLNQQFANISGFSTKTFRGNCGRLRLPDGDQLRQCMQALPVDQFPEYAPQLERWGEALTASSERMRWGAPPWVHNAKPDDKLLSGTCSFRARVHALMTQLHVSEGDLNRRMGNMNAYFWTRPGQLPRSASAYDAFEKALFHTVPPSERSKTWKTYHRAAMKASWLKEAFQVAAPEASPKAASKISARR